MAMKQITVAVNAKLNLTLNILGKRADGYHDVQMIMQSVSLHDMVSVSEAKGEGTVLETDSGEVPHDGNNIACKAAALFFERAGFKNPGIRIKINKNIPVAAGLAGGSADAAGTLMALNGLFEAGLNIGDLESIGVQVGADVPFCLEGSTQLAEGIGEKLTALPAMPDCPIVLAKMEDKIPTASAYTLFDKIGAVNVPDSIEMADALYKGDIREIAKDLGNVFEEVLNLDSVKKIKTVMLENGACGAAMSGSGPSVFGLFDSYDQARACAGKLDMICKNVFLCRPVKTGCEIVTG